MTEVPKLRHKLSCDGVIRDGSGNYVIRKSIWLPVQSNYRMLSHTCICCINLKKKRSIKILDTLHLLSPRFFKKVSGILQSPPSVCPSRYLLLNHWTKFNQIWCVSCSHEWGVQRYIFFGPAPWGPGEGPKVQISLIIIKFQLLSQFQRFLNQTLCVFSQMKDIKHIRRDFHLAMVVP